MDSPSIDKTERITAILSAVVAVAILAGGAIAYQSKNAPVEDMVQLESDFRFQLEVGFRHNPNERAQRLESLEQVKQAWGDSPRTLIDQQKLADWLLEATIRSMPGSIEPLPQAPHFGEPATEAVPQEASVVPSLPVVKRAAVAASAAPRVTPPVAQTRATLSPPVAIQPKARDAVTVAALAAEAMQPVAGEPTAVVQFPAREQPVAATFATSTPFAVTATAQRVRVNFAELTARIAGYHRGLNDLEAEFRAFDGEDLTILSRWAEELAGLTADYRFVQLYFNTLTQSEQRTLTAPRPLAPTLAALQRQLTRAEQAQVDDFLGEFDATHQARVAQLREQLATLAADIAQ